MKIKFNYKALFASIIAGLIFVFGFASISGSNFGNALFPTLALLTAFIITGFITGVISKGITIAEPGLGSILVAIISYFLMPELHLKGFEGLYTSDWFLILMNAIIMTFIGAWLGEKYQHGTLTGREDEMIIIDWSWIVAGTITGVIISIFMVNLLDIIFGPNPSSFYIPFFFSLLLLGIAIGWKSPGITILEAGIAGFLTITIDFNIVRLTIYDNNTPIEFAYIIIGLIAGFIISLIGGYIGEKIQHRKS